MIEKSFDLVAQSVEHLTFNQVAAGSNPAGVTESPLMQRAFFWGGDRILQIIKRTLYQRNISGTYLSIYLRCFN